jgi:hypothetical protein
VNIGSPVLALHWIAKRRSRRIALMAPVEISGKDVEKSSFTLITTATNLNRNGAMLRLNLDLAVHSVVVIQNSRGARTSARIVEQTSTAEGVYAYGVEFLEPGHLNDFWGISFNTRPSSSQGRH